MIDVDNNGQIERSQLHEILVMTAEEMGIEKPSKEQTKEIMKTLDTQSKGYLSKYFCHYLQIRFYEFSNAGAQTTKIE